MWSTENQLFTPNTTIDATSPTRVEALPGTGMYVISHHISKHSALKLFSSQSFLSPLSVAWMGETGNETTFKELCFSSVVFNLQDYCWSLMMEALDSCSQYWES